MRFLDSAGSGNGEFPGKNDDLDASGRGWTAQYRTREDSSQAMPRQRDPDCRAPGTTAPTRRNTALSARRTTRGRALCAPTTAREPPRGPHRHRQPLSSSTKAPPLSASSRGAALGPGSDGVAAGNHRLRRERRAQRASAVERDQRHGRRTTESSGDRRAHDRRQSAGERLTGST